ncbi:hypothetical protein COMA1_10197 [Candidatus Nitrospira nitrosa]|uniref:Uncharacterized protein n=1 Tax=Candidatus Nitrospira nitrosa TaxID=1742972 RepID=A0A0S4L1W2_9BACT|nr:hypothetical protein COMA1_10197 [Candidatus Nitrospira nitrosa]
MRSVKPVVNPNPTSNRQPGVRTVYRRVLFAPSIQYVAASYGEFMEGHIHVQVEKAKASSRQE